MNRLNGIRIPIRIRISIEWRALSLSSSSSSSFVQSKWYFFSSSFLAPLRIQCIISSVHCASWHIRSARTTTIRSFVRLGVAKVNGLVGSNRTENRWCEIQMIFVWCVRPGSCSVFIFEHNTVYCEWNGSNYWCALCSESVARKRAPDIIVLCSIVVVTARFSHLM